MSRSSDVLVQTDRSILVLGISGVVVGVSRSTGEACWRNTLSGGGGGEVFLAFRHGVLVVSAAGSALFRIDHRNGNTLWQKATSGSGRATIVVEPDLIVIAKGGYVDGFGHDGGLRWKQPLRGMGMGRMALAFPDNVSQADGAGGADFDD